MFFSFSKGIRFSCGKIDNYVHIAANPLKNVSSKRIKKSLAFSNTNLLPPNILKAFSWKKLLRPSINWARPRNGMTLRMNS